MEVNIIFLDIDGVICLGKEIDKKCLQNLKAIIDVTSARIVLSFFLEVIDNFLVLCEVSND